MRSKKMYQKVYSVLFILSLMLFLFNFLVQGHISFTYYDYYGLISKMGIIYWVGYAFMIALIFFHYTNFEKMDKRYAYLTIVLMVVYLISTPFLHEYLPRFEDTWAHSHLAEIFYQTGEAAGTGYSYEQYPGSFVFYGVLFDLFGNFEVMRFFPFLFYTVGAFVIYLTFRDMIDSKKALLIVIIYMLFSWTVEDNHISPQFLAFNLYLVFMFFTTRLLYGTKNWKWYISIIAVLSIAIAFSHVFTPVFIISILAFTGILCKKFRNMAFAILIIVLIPFLIHELYFSTFLPSFIASFKGIEGLFSFSVKFAGTSYFSRQVLVGSRMLILATSIVLGILGIRILSKKGHKTTSRFILSWAFSMLPFLILMSLILKGEFAERFVLVSSLPLAVATTYFLTSRKSQAIVLIFLIVMTPLYYVGKYGNEAFETQSLEKLKVDCFSALYESDCDQESILVDSPLDYIEDLGETHFSVTREEIIWSQIYGSHGINENLFELISRIEDEKALDRIYSTNNAWSYV